jgi:cell division protein FtsW
VKNNLAKLNYVILLLMIVYSAFGLLMIFSASSVAAVLRYKVSTNYFFLRQLLWTALGYAGGLVVLKVSTKYYRFFSKLAMFGIIFLLAFIFMAGFVAGGAQSWYDLGLVNFQPMEIGKIILIIYLAVHYHKISSKKNITLYDMIYPLILAAIMCVLIAMQPDFGGAFIVFLITLLTFVSLPIGKKHKKMVYKMGGIAVLVLGIAILLFGKNILHSYQVSRLVYFTNPCQRYSEDTGYQVCNGYIAIKNGGLTGVGLGNSTQKYLYLPEAHTDFIFPIICEELGLIVGIIILVGYFILLYTILGIAKETTTLRDSILCYGVFVYLLCHILINILGILGLIPLTGVPLPFLSYGGSYNICVIISIFMVERVNIENYNNKALKKLEKL